MSKPKINNQKQNSIHKLQRIGEKIIANKYKNKIPQKLFDILYNYEVEITD